MDAVELEVPAAVKLVVGPEGFGSNGGTEVVVEKVELLQSRPSINGRSSLVSKKDGGVRACELESALRSKIPDATNYSHSSQISSFHEKGALEEVSFGSINISLPLTSGLDAKQLQHKIGKVGRPISGSSKKSRVVQTEISALESGTEDVKRMSSEPAKCNVPERSHISKQKNNSNSKRGDKRNGKLPKSKSDSFCLKNGLMSFSSAAGGSKFLGMNVSKPDLFDFAEHVDELPLQELLAGSYKCPIYANDKGKKEVSNENLLHSVRKAWSILRLEKPVQPQNNADIDSSYNKKAVTGLLSYCSTSGNKLNGDEGGTLTTSQLCDKGDKEYLGNQITPAITVDSPLHQPMEVLERLAFSPSKELDTLLIDAAKPAVSSRNSTDHRVGKPVSCRTGLPPFPWSHSSSAHCKSGSDVSRLSTARNTCQGRCVRIENSLTPLNGATGFSVDMESLTFDRSLVPVAAPKSVPSEIKKVSSASFGCTSDRVLSSSAACSTSQGPPDDDSPKAMAAAQTLCDIAILSQKQTPNGTIKSLNNSSKRALKTCKLKTKEKPEYQFPTLGADSLLKSDILCSSKKLKLSEDVKRNEIGLTNSARKVPVNWSAPRSIRSSPSKLSRDSLRETKNYSINIVKKSGLMPPPSRVIDKACSSQQKVRKVVSMEWTPSGSKLN